MANDEQNDDTSGNGSGGNQIAKFSGIAFQMIVVIGIFTFAGVKIDAAMDHPTKWATAGLSLTGVFIALYIVIKSIKS